MNFSLASAGWWWSCCGLCHMLLFDGWPRDQRIDSLERVL